jgi:CHRD domain-containing protein
MGKLALRGLVVVVVIGLLGVGSFAIAGGGTKNFSGDPLNGYEENPDISTVASGSFEARLSNDGTSLSYELRYSGLEGGPATASHVHFGKPAVNGGVSFFLCGGGTKPACPPGTTTEAVVTGTVIATDVIGPTGQGIPAGGFPEILAAMRAGHAYANVHNATFPGGEIRAQLNNHGEDDD